MKSFLEAVKKEWFWAIARSCGPARELSRVRAFIDSVGGASETLSEIRWQRPLHGYFPGLSVKAWHDPAEYPWTARLVESYETIRAEADRIAARQLYSPQIGSFATGEWNVLHLHVMGEATPAGKLLCPRTSRLTSELPGVGEGGMVYFSCLAGGTHVAPHCGMSNTRLRCHIGLKVPPGCSIRVGDEEREWNERKVIVFDDSIEHEVWNRSNETRWVLIVDFWHPELTPVERKALARLSYFRRQERNARTTTLRLAKDAERQARLRPATAPD